jgi:DNA-binding response OmpR family regulator
MAEDAFALLKNGQTINIILSEVHLDGFALARRIRQEYPNVDVILASGIPGAAVKAEDLCAQGLLVKPYHFEEIVRRVNITMERRQTAGDSHEDIHSAQNRDCGAPA